MIVLVLNAGSSTLKFQLIRTDLEAMDEERDEHLASGTLERIGGLAIVTGRTREKPRVVLEMPIRDHREAIERIVPTSYAPRFDVERMSIVAHEGDRICPIQHTRALVQAWQVPHYTEVVGGHWVYLDHQVRGRTWYGWLQRMGYLSPAT